LGAFEGAFNPHISLRPRKNELEQWRGGILMGMQHNQPYREEMETTYQKKKMCSLAVGKKGKTHHGEG